MKYDVMPLGPVPLGPPTNRHQSAPATPAARQVKPGVLEGADGRMFTRLMSYELASPADHGMLQRDLPPGRRDAAHRGGHWPDLGYATPVEQMKAAPAPAPAPVAASEATRAEASTKLLQLISLSKPVATDLLARYGVRRVVDMDPARYGEFVAAADLVIAQLQGFRTAAAHLG